MNAMQLASPESLLEALDPDQRKVARYVSGPLAVHAGAGTGKTRAITYRIAYAAAVGAYDPRHVLAVTFTAKAAAQMRTRLAALGIPQIQARTFHAAALRQLTYFWPSVIGGPAPTIVDHKASLVAAAAARIGKNVDKALVRDIAAEIEWAKVSMLDIDAYGECILSGKRPLAADLTVEDILRLMDAYEDAKAERRVIDFEDVLLIMCGLLHERTDVAQQIRAQYRHFVVDEYQDISQVQKHLLYLWLGERHDICVVGDVAQTIYSFAGASGQHLLDFANEHPGAHVIELYRDYRSTPQIVEAANTVMKVGLHKADATFEPVISLVSQRASGAPISCSVHEDDEAEATYIATKIRAYQEAGESLNDIAVLYRTNSQSEVFEHALTQADIPFTLRGGAQFFEREEVRKAMLVLRRIAANTVESVSQGKQDDMRVAGNEHSLQKKKGDGDIFESGGEEKNVYPSLVERVSEALLIAGWTPQAPETRGVTRERWDNLNAIVELARAHPSMTMTEFVTELEERAQGQVEPPIHGVVLSTIHAAKGLEWKHVFVIGLSEGLLPISHALSDQACEEERRLLYVALTRARDTLELSWAHARHAYSSKKKRQPSRFLRDLCAQQESLAL
ncbi:ATP-dependent helicase [Schaalia sp. lx-100]|uniref:ATP-dependent helicase n=1 Tax=Schaalia sp. lx-100 TaxID=2899081 RepID=UPI001E4C574C|nr:ATP-dependent helicase [Schaalia sp. lx-100]MCD4558107.1 ATP-dependent helicase [Schaalia sp. lx-100]